MAKRIGKCQIAISAVVLISALALTVACRGSTSEPVAILNLVASGYPNSCLWVDDDLLEYLPKTGDKFDGRVINRAEFYTIQSAIDAYGLRDFR